MIRPNRQIWLCLYFPALALEIFADRDLQPLAIVEQQRVFNINAQASARGLEAGMALNTAHALCPGLLALERQPSREQEALQQLAHWVYRFSPDLALAADNSLLVEIGACRRLYGGITPLLDLLQSGLHERGHAVAPGLAHTRKAAWLLARQLQPLALEDEQFNQQLHYEKIDNEQLHQQPSHCEQLHCEQSHYEKLNHELLRSQLGALPVTALAIDNAIIDALQKMGIRTLQGLSDLPLAALGKRFGAGFIRYLQQVLGTHPDPQPSFTPLQKFQAGLSFIDGVHNRQALLFPMQRLLRTLCDYLQSRQLLCGALQWELHDAHAPQATIAIELMHADAARGQQRLRDLLELSELKLQTVALRDAVYTLRLYSDTFVPMQAQSLQLFAEEETQNGSFTTLIDKLRARLGADALQIVSYRDVHWPEAASLQQSIDIASATIDAPIDKSRAAAPETIESSAELARPLWLLPTPQALRERDNKPFWFSTLQLLRGPERIGNHWWEQSYTARDYYVARAEDGRLCWIFRDLNSGQWFGHGLFA
jgi:protein ImuB